MSLDPLYIAVSWVLLRWHSLFTAIGLPSSGGLNWALSIVFLVVTARVILFRFFIKQVHYQRRMQDIQPKIKKLQEKHKGDRATLNREMTKMQQEEGFNPISGCLPMLLQFPIFISLFHVLKHMSAAASPTYPEAKKTLYTFTKTQTFEAAHARLFGAPLAGSLRESSYKIHQLGGDLGSTRIVIVILVVISAAATMITQRAVMANATTPPEGQAALIQRVMMFGIPASVVFSGLIFPLGVLLYWFTSNLWTMGQQFYILRFHPHVPGGTTTADKSAPTKTAAPRPGQRPVRNPRAGSAPAPTGGVSLSNDEAPAKTADNVAKDATASPDTDRPPGSSNPTKPAPGKRSPAKAGPRPRTATASSASGSKRSPSKKRR